MRPAIKLPTDKTPRFAIGQIVATPGALALADEGVNLGELIGRHWAGDWSEMDEEDQQENELSLTEGFRIFSSYTTQRGRVWVITEADRSLTTLLLPDEY